jgi:hypothetical protein
VTDRDVAHELRIVPEPTPEERQAITATLADTDALPPAYRSAWRRAGMPVSEDDLTPELGREVDSDPTGGAP